MELLLQNVTKNFGGLRAVGDVSFSVKDNVIFGLIGPNGAGKTTVFNLITGVYKHDKGTITFGSTDIAKLKPAEIAGAGIARTFQNIRLFGQLTVLENLLVACELQKRAHLAAAVLRSPVHYEDEKAMHDRALELLRVFDLHEMADEVPTSLSYGNQRRLEIARAMMLRPKLLLLDEPAAGMNYGEAEGLKTQIRWLRDTFDLSIVLVEHNMQVVMGVCEEIHVLDHGETIAHGPPEEIRKDPKVLAAYLGEEEESAESVRAAVKEASRPDVSKLVPASTPRLPKVAPASDPKLAADTLAADSRPLSEPELDEISKDLIQNLERGLSEPDADEALADLSPKSEPPAALADPAKKDDASPPAKKEPAAEPAKKEVSAPPPPAAAAPKPTPAAAEPAKKEATRPKSAPPPAVAPKSVPPPAVARKSVPPPAVERKSAPPPAAARKSVPPPAVERKSVPPPAVERKSAPPPAASSKLAPSSPAAASKPAAAEAKDASKSAAPRPTPFKKVIVRPKSSPSGSMALPSKQPQSAVPEKETAPPPAAASPAGSSVKVAAPTAEARPISAPPPSPFVKVAEPKEDLPPISVPPPTPFVKEADPKEDLPPISVPPPSPLAKAAEVEPAAISPRPKMITRPFIDEAELGGAVVKETEPTVASSNEPLPHTPEPFALAESVRKIAVAKPVAVDAPEARAGREEKPAKKEDGS